MDINVDKIKLLKGQLPQYKLADKANISRNGLFLAFKRGYCRPETVLKLAEALNVDPQEIILNE